MIFVIVVSQPKNDGNTNLLGHVDFSLIQGPRQSWWHSCWQLGSRIVLKIIFLYVMVSIWPHIFEIFRHFVWQTEKYFHSRISPFYLSIIFELNKANVAFFMACRSCLFEFSRIFSNETLRGDSLSSQFSNFVLMNFLDFTVHVVQAVHLARVAFFILPSTCRWRSSFDQPRDSCLIKYCNRHFQSRIKSLESMKLHDSCL